MSEEETISCNDTSLMEDRKKGSLKHKKRHDQFRKSVSSTEMIEMTDEEKKQIDILGAMKYPKITRLDLLNYLRAQNGNVEEAAKYAREGSKWRLRFKPQSIRINDVATLLREFGCWVGPTAKNGYPVIWIENFSAYKTINSIEEIIKMLSYCIESILCHHDKFNFVVDLANLSLTSIDDRMIRMMMQIIELNYPGSIEQIIVTNVPFWVKGLYAVVKSWVDPKWRNVLGLHSNYDYLPQVFGQTAVPLRFKGKASDDLCAERFVKNRMQEEEINSTTPTHVSDDAVRLWLDNAETSANKITNAVFSKKMKKVGGIVKLWKEFYFVLENNATAGGVLYYFKSMKDAAPAGAVLLEDSSLIRDVGKKNCFDIQTPLRLWHFQAESEEDLKRWCELIEPLCVPSTVFDDAKKHEKRKTKKHSKERVKSGKHKKSEKKSSHSSKKKEEKKKEKNEENEPTEQSIKEGEQGEQGEQGEEQTQDEDNSSEESDTNSN